jgi:hypothetical protein
MIVRAPLAILVAIFVAAGAMQPPAARCAQPRCMRRPPPDGHAHLSRCCDMRPTAARLSAAPAATGVSPDAHAAAILPVRVARTIHSPRTLSAARPIEARAHAPPTDRYLDHHALLV